MHVLSLARAALVAAGLESRAVDLAYLGMPPAKSIPVFLACASRRVPGRVGDLIAGRGIASLSEIRAR